VLEELEDVGLGPGDIDLVGVDEAQAAHEVDHVEAAVEDVEEGAVDELEVAPVAGEVVVGVGEGVDDELHADADYHHYAQHGRLLLHRVVVLEDEPLGADAHADGHDDEHGQYCEVDLRLDGLGISEVVLTAAEQLVAFHFYYITNTFKPTPYNPPILIPPYPLPELHLIR